MADELDKLVYVLTTVSHVREHSPLKSIMENPQKQVLKLLDGIALALTTKAKGDVTAVRMKQSPTGIEFLFSKNAPSNGYLDRYLKAVTEIIAGNDDMETMQVKLSKLVIYCCVEKFKSRVIKCRKAAESSKSITPSQDTDLSNLLQIWHGLSFTEIMQRFFGDLCEMDSSVQVTKADITKCLRVSQQACIMGLSSGFRKQLLENHPILLRRVQKLGAYFELGMRVRTLLSTPNLFKLRNSIRFTEISPTQQQICFIPRNIADLFNEDAKRSGEELIELEDVELRYPDLSLPTTEFARLTVSTHCELTLVLHALYSPTKPDTIVVGVSKGLCWLCQKFVKYLKVAGAIQVSVSQYQGKIQAGWGMPPNTPPVVDFLMRDLIQHEVQELRARIIARRENCSFANDLEDDAFDKETCDPPPARRSDLSTLK